MQKIKCPNCYTELGERNEDEVFPNTNTDVVIQNGMISFECKCGRNIEVGLSSSVKQLWKRGMKRIL